VQANENHVVVIGAGITGLACAHTLLRGSNNISVTVVEAADQIGGVIRTSPFAGLPAVDEAADAFLLRVPAGIALARGVGLGDSLTSPTSVHASVWRKQLHPLPAGLLLGVPTNFRALATSPLISFRGKLRALADVLLPSTSTASDSLGHFMRARFGNEVHEMLIDPLVGSIYAADTDRFSLQAIPQLRDLASEGRSLLLATRKRPKTAPVSKENPIFAAPFAGMGALIDASANAVVSLGGKIRTSCRIENIEPSLPGATARYALQVNTKTGVEILYANHVVVCIPAKHAAPLFSSSEKDTSALLNQSEHASVVMVALAIPKSSLPKAATGSGYLVPKPEQRFVTAVSFASQKWAHLNTGDSAVLRVSLGRDGVPLHEHDDDQLMSYALADLKKHLGKEIEPTEVRITRWKESFPQYRPHHFQFVAHIESHLLEAMPGVQVAGASYKGIGVPSCIEQGTTAAKRILDSLQHPTVTIK